MDDGSMIFVGFLGAIAFFTSPFYLVGVLLRLCLSNARPIFIVMLSGASSLFLASLAFDFSVPGFKKFLVVTWKDIICFPEDDVHGMFLRILAVTAIGISPFIFSGLFALAGVNKVDRIRRKKNATPICSTEEPLQIPSVEG